MSAHDSTPSDNTRFIRAYPQLVDLDDPAEDYTSILVQRARREAAALAWSTGYPFLVLPCLTEELETQARNYARKQSEVREQSARFFTQTFPIASKPLAA